MRLSAEKEGGVAGVVLSLLLDDVVSPTGDVSGLSSEGGEL